MLAPSALAAFFFLPLRVMKYFTPAGDRTPSRLRRSAAMLASSALAAMLY
jgi:hypothetical protein